MGLRVAVAASGRGSNLVALLRALQGDASAVVVLVLSDRRAAAALEVARLHGIPAQVLRDPLCPDEWLDTLRASGVELLVLAGLLKKMPGPVVRRWAGRIINVHPALLPRHGGVGMYGHHVHEAVLAAGDQESGATVHLVTEEFDQGPILGQLRVPVLPGDTPDRLAARVLAAEHRLLPAAVLAAAAAGKPVPFQPADLAPRP